jgi:hypothetical protein
VLDRRVDVFELRLDDFLSLLQFLLKVRLLLAGHFLKPDVTYRPQAHCFPLHFGPMRFASALGSRLDRQEYQTNSSDNQAASTRETLFGGSPPATQRSAV